MGAGEPASRRRGRSQSSARPGPGGCPRHPPPRFVSQTPDSIELSGMAVAYSTNASRLKSESRSRNPGKDPPGPTHPCSPHAVRPCPSSSRLRVTRRPADPGARASGMSLARLFEIETYALLGTIVAQTVTEKELESWARSQARRFQPVGAFGTIQEGGEASGLPGLGRGRLRPASPSAGRRVALARRLCGSVRSHHRRTPRGGAGLLPQGQRQTTGAPWRGTLCLLGLRPAQHPCRGHVRTAARPWSTSQRTSQGGSSGRPSRQRPAHRERPDALRS